MTRRSYEIFLVIKYRTNFCKSMRDECLGSTLSSGKCHIRVDRKSRVEGKEEKCLGSGVGRL